MTDAERNARIAAYQAELLESKVFVLFVGGKAVETSARPWAWERRGAHNEPGNEVKSLTVREARALGLYV